MLLLGQMCKAILLNKNPGQGGDKQQTRIKEGGNINQATTTGQIIDLKTRKKEKVNVQSN